MRATPVLALLLPFSLAGTAVGHQNVLLSVGLVCAVALGMLGLAGTRAVLG